VPLLKTQNKSHTREHKALIRPVVLYASNTWTLSHSAAQMIGSFERNILQRIHWPAQINGGKKCRDYIKQSFWTYCSRTISGSRGILNVSWNNHFQWLLYRFMFLFHIYHIFISVSWGPNKSHWSNLSIDSNRLRNTGKTHSACNVHCAKRLKWARHVARTFNRITQRILERSVGERKAFKE